MCIILKVSINENTNMSANKEYFCDQRCEKRNMAGKCKIFVIVT